MSLKIAREILRAEARAVGLVARQLDDRFLKALRLIYKAKGSVVVMGMGKPGFIAQKISASLASTGTRSIAFHPADAAHGDLGRIHKGDVLLFLSKSGQTEEIVRLLPAIRKLRCPVIAMTSAPDSLLAKSADVVLNIPVQDEAGPLGIAPTTSTSCMLALGDALTMALAHTRRFKRISKC